MAIVDANLDGERGLIWLEQGRYHRAIADFEHATKIDAILPVDHQS